jgi:hypothetical protein
LWNEIPNWECPSEMAHLKLQNAGNGTPNWWENDDVFLPKFEKPVSK